ncbi:TRAP-type C4-dicarboxylate transport system, substrate-binding protein [Cohaesibacter marisflavi]|uniref:TRAP-type C4-dicarboxylate transport system, substrate-binding protein n=1 Tax=Cohaesibacter marisflavi TaxID=655353 RepID=A0A1I5JSV2_9HYPH|nr:TRAP transporter substrate-binding protein [Cohaesibacter marisflavi]SFO75868.1 TRAP-type C4-dicarboxylate transport system, substrate-binding protein [Cohaesibacter marisflavi]
MTISRRNFLAGAMLAVSMFASGGASAETKLVLSSWLPPRHPLVMGAIKPWAKQVDKVTEGRVTVRVLTKPLGAPPAHFDMAKDGVADITYGLHSFTKDDRFLRSRIGQFSFLGKSATEISKNFWTIYGGQLEAAKEHEGTKLLGLFTHGPGVLLSKDYHFDSPDRFQGFKLRTPGGYPADLMSGVGATTLFMSSGEVYEKLTRGVIDGICMAMDSVRAFKLDKHITDVMTVPGGLYNTSWFLVMNQAKWDGISDEDKTAIMSISGEAFSELAGKAWDEADAKGLASTKKAGITVYAADEAVLGKILDVSAGVEKLWIEAVEAQGYDAAAALASMQTVKPNK